MIGNMKSLKRRVNPEDVAAGEAVSYQIQKKPFILWAILTISLGLLLFNVLQRYIVSCPVGLHAVPCAQPQPLVSNEVIVQVITAIFAAIFVIQQLSFSAFPDLSYRSKRSTTGESITNTKTNLYWRVDLINSGPGSAKIEEIYYVTETSKLYQDKTNLSYELARNTLLDSSFIEYEDFLLWKISKGASIGPGMTVTLFECDDALRGSEIKTLDIIILYRGRMGDGWAKRIMCIPDRRAPMAQ